MAINVLPVPVPITATTLRRHASAKSSLWYALGTEDGRLVITGRVGGYGEDVDGACPRTI
jgi:hypothetical protein